MKKAIITPLLYYFRFWAQLALKLYKPTVIGITGSVGKSSARNTIYGMLKDHFPTKSIEKGNSEIGLPLGILGLQVKSLGFQTVFLSIFDYIRLLIMAPINISYLKNTKYLVVEMGIDSPFPPQNMEYLLSIVKPDISVFLNVHPTHTQEFDKVVPSEITGKDRLEKILDAIAIEKGKIITQSNCSVAVYNGDNAHIKKVIESYKEKASSQMEFLTFGESSVNKLCCSDFNVDEKGTSFVLSHGTQRFQLYVHKYILPKEYAEIFGSAVLLGKHLGLTIPDIIKSIEKNFVLPAGRASIFEGIKDSIIIDSSYNASKAAVLAFLDLVKTLKSKLVSPVVFIFGDMRELGKESQMEHEEVADKILEVVDYLYCVGPQTKEYVIPKTREKLKEVKWFENSVEAGKYARNNLSGKSLVLVKGSQNTIFLEEAIKPLLDNKEDENKLCRQSSYWLQKKGVN